MTPQISLWETWSYLRLRLKGIIYQRTEAEPLTTSVSSWWHNQKRFHASGWSKKHWEESKELLQAVQGEILFPLMFCSEISTGWLELRTRAVPDREVAGKCKGFSLTILECLEFSTSKYIWVFLVWGFCCFFGVRFVFCVCVGCFWGAGFPTFPVLLCIHLCNESRLMSELRIIYALYLRKTYLLIDSAPIMEFKVLNHIAFQKTKIQISELLLCFSPLHSHQKGIWFFLLLHPNCMSAFVAAAYWLQHFFGLSAWYLSLCQVLIVNLYQTLSYSAKKHLWIILTLCSGFQKKKKSKKFQNNAFTGVILLFDIFLYCGHY